MTALDLAVTVTTQQIIQGEIQDVRQIQSILSGVSPEVQAEVIKQFRTNETLRMYFPEKAIIFDENDFDNENKWKN